MSSTGSSASSSTSLELPAGPVRPPARVYRGKEYLAVAELPLDPLVHPQPWRPTWPYRAVFWFVRNVFLPVFMHYQVAGRENIPKPPFIIAANHRAWFDTLLIVAAFPKRPMIYTMARRDTVFNTRFKRWLVPRFGVFPVQPSRGQLDESAVAIVYQLLARGACVLVFPEGGYSRGTDLRPLKKGVAHFALQSGVPICPVAIEGLGRRLRLFADVEVSIGPPIWPDPPAFWSLNQRANRLLERVRLGILSAFDRQPNTRRRWLRAGVERP
jgi:1-acyl-sn-glycerol-3-phosphate acyltransferase